jgi:hypothetical protein
LHSLPGDVRLVTCATRTRLMGCAHSRGVSGWLHGGLQVMILNVVNPPGRGRTRFIRGLRMIKHYMIGRD